MTQDDASPDAPAARPGSSGASPEVTSGAADTGPHAAARVQWQQPLLWAVVALSALLVLASFTGDGTGMFGWGFMMGMMWMWMLVPLLVVVLVVVLVLQLQRR